MRFNVFDKVTHQQPKLIDNEDDGLHETPRNSNVKGIQRTGPNAPIGVSSAFEQLLRQLAQQHVNELSDMRTRTQTAATGHASSLEVREDFVCFAPSDGTADMEKLGTPLMTPSTRTASSAVMQWQKAREQQRRSGRRANADSSLEGKTGRADESGLGFGNFALGLDCERSSPEMPMRSVRSQSKSSSRSRKDGGNSPSLVHHIMQSKNQQRETIRAYSLLSLWESRDDTGSVLPRCLRCRKWLQSKFFEIAMVSILLANVLWIAMRLQVIGMAMELGSPSSSWTVTFLVGDLVFAAIFALEFFIRCYVSGWRFWRSWVSYLDLFVGISCVLEFIVILTARDDAFDFAMLCLFRLIKIVKSMRMFNINSILAPLHLLTKCPEACVGMLFWSFLLMSFVQCVAGIVVSELCYSFLRDSNDPEARAVVYQYYGTFTRTILTMFEIMFANWGPACRVLVENVSEWFSVFFLVYRCVMGFAVLNVVGAVFVQQALKTAASDEDLAFRQKERDIASYNRKVKKLFCSIDGSGDGNISLDEFTKLVQSPKLKFWMSQLELEYHDLLSLFEFLDNGDGQITLVEFIEGAQRLRGSAKALDIWRMETKIEVLFEEVLQMMAENLPQATETNVASVFEKSNFKHIKATTVRTMETMETVEDVSTVPSEVNE